MTAIRPDQFPELHRQLTEGNLRRQFDLLRDMASVGIQTKFRVTMSAVLVIHSHATVHLVAEPGCFRDDFVHIKSSDHVPPSYEKIKELMFSFIAELNQRWEKDEVFQLAAFALWRLCWIHPFEDGNGRTARALAYLIICMKFKQWLPGEKTLMQKIKEHHAEYSSALRHADRTESEGCVDLIPLARLIAENIREQISGILPTA